MIPSELVDLVKREFPGWTVLPDNGPTQGPFWMWRGDGPEPGADDRVLVWESGEYYGLGPLAPLLTAPDLLTAAEYATGETRLSRRAKAEPETGTGQVVTREPRKNFTTKPRLDLIPPGVLARHVLPVLHDGATKHGRDHWRKCTRREYVLAAVTHAMAYLDGDETDESGHEALAHAAADLMLALGVGK